MVDYTPDPLFAPVTDNDWEIFSGAEGFAVPGGGENARPLISWTHRVDDHEASVIVDGQGVYVQEFLNAEGDTREYFAEWPLAGRWLAGLGVRSKLTGDELRTAGFTVINEDGPQS